jgi:hypothetical protein
MVRNVFKDDDDDPNFVSRRVEVTGTVQVRVRPGSAQVLLPPEYSASGEWLTMKKLSVTDDAISGRIQVGLLSTADVNVDRISGTLILKGDNGSFTGRCTAADPAKRAF